MLITLLEHVLVKICCSKKETQNLNDQKLQRLFHALTTCPSQVAGHSAHQSHPRTQADRAANGPCRRRILHWQLNDLAWKETALMTTTVDMLKTGVALKPFSASN